MKITKKKLRRIIEEEISNVVDFDTMKIKKSLQEQEFEKEDSLDKLKRQITNSAYKNRRVLLQRAFKKLIDDKDIIEISNLFFKGGIKDRTEDPIANLGDKIGKAARGAAGLSTRATHPLDKTLPRMVYNAAMRSSGKKHKHRGHEIGGITYPEITRKKIEKSVEDVILDFIPKKYSGDLDKIRKEFPNLILVLRDIAFYKTIFFNYGGFITIGTLIHELAHQLYLPGEDDDEPLIPRWDDDDDATILDKIHAAANMYGSWNAEAFATRKTVEVIRSIKTKIPSLIRGFKNAYRIKAPDDAKIERRLNYLQREIGRSLAAIEAGQLNYYRTSQKAAKTSGGAFDPALSNYGFKVADPKSDKLKLGDLDSTLKSEKFLENKRRFEASLDKLTMSYKPTPGAGLEGPTKFADCTKHIVNAYSSSSKEDYNTYKMYESRWTNVINHIKNWETTLLGEYNLPIPWVKVTIFNLLLKMVVQWPSRFYPRGVSKAEWRIDYQWTSKLPSEWFCIMKKFDFQSLDPKDMPSAKSEFKVFRRNPN